MSVNEIITLIISSLALFISALTAYRTFFSRFKGEVYVHPFVMLVKTIIGPSIVITCEISNPGSKSGTIEDVFLAIKYRQRNSINKHSFLPYLMRNDFNVFKNYNFETDFEPFQAIPVPANSRITKCIVFRPSDENFGPSAGEIDVQVYNCNSNMKRFSRAKGNVIIVLDNSHVELWIRPNGKSVLVEAEQNLKRREKFMEELYG